MSSTLLADPVCLTDRLEEMLSESVNSATQREQTAFDQMAAPFEPRLVLFGCGSLGRKTLAGLRKVGIEPLAFADNNSARWGTTIEGLSVLSPTDAAAEFGQNAAFVITIWNGNAADCMADRIRQLSALGCARAIPAGFLFWKYSDIFLPCYPLDLPHKVLLQADRVRAAFQLWTDEASAREYLAQLEFRLHLNYDGLRTSGESHYFAPDVYRLSARETLIDCGAFDGDTIRSFIARQGEHFSRILAYEPDPLNRSKLEQAVATLPEPIRSRIACFPQAVGTAAGYVAFEATGTDLSATGAGGTTVECVTLDESLRDVKSTILKFDIEGAEPEALRGAAHTIRTHAPVLAVSTYHLQNHLWEIPLLISSLRDGYRFFLRPHGTEGWDLVCYAVPASRQAPQTGWERNCPVCSGSSRRTLFSQSFDQLSGVRLLDGYDVVVCNDCGAAFADHIPPQPVFDSYYRDLSKYEENMPGRDVSPYEESRSRQIAATILPHVPDPRARVLEIGCATGHLLSVLKEQGLVNVCGVDPSPGCARTVCEHYGIPAEAHSIFDIPTPAYPFDFLILVGVMEHIRDLDKAADKIRDLLAPRGRVYLAVPDAGHFADVKDAPFQEFSVEHLNFFSASSLNNFMQRRGFRFVSGGRLRYEVSRGTWLAAVYGVFENAPPGAVVCCARDEETEPSLAAYIRASEQVEARAGAIIRELARTARPIFVWGVGAHTLRLLAAGALDRVNIRAFVDSNPKYQGRQLHGRPVLAPRELADRTEPILISSYAAQHEISRQIRDHLKLANEIVTLYEPGVQP